MELSCATFSLINLYKDPRTFTWQETASCTSQTSFCTLFLCTNWVSHEHRIKQWTPSPSDCRGLSAPTENRCYVLGHSHEMLIVGVDIWLIEKVVLCQKCMLPYSLRKWGLWEWIAMTFWTWIVMTFWAWIVNWLHGSLIDFFDGDSYDCGQSTDYHIQKLVTVTFESLKKGEFWWQIITLFWGTLIEISGV